MLGVPDRVLGVPDRVLGVAGVGVAVAMHVGSGRRTVLILAGPPVGGDLRAQRCARDPEQGPVAGEVHAHPLGVLLQLLGSEGRAGVRGEVLRGEQGCGERA